MKILIAEDDKNISNIISDSIKEFEKDVINGKNVDVTTYVNNKHVDYSNKFTESGEKFSEAVTKILTEGFSGAWDAIKVLFF